LPRNCFRLGQICLDGNMRSVTLFPDNLINECSGTERAQ